jgi:hypothetical protein
VVSIELSCVQLLAGNLLEVGKNVLDSLVHVGDSASSLPWLFPAVISTVSGFFSGVIPQVPSPVVLVFKLYLLNVVIVDLRLAH